MTTSQRPSAQDGQVPLSDPSRPADDASPPGYGQAQEPLVFAPPPRIPQQRAPETRTPRNGPGIGAVCVGAAGLLLFLVPFTGLFVFLLGATGVALGIVGFLRTRRREVSNPGIALAGVALSVGAVVLGIWGMVTIVQSVTQLYDDLANGQASSSRIGTTTDSVPSSTAPSSAATSARGATTFRLDVTGTGNGAAIQYGAGLTSGGGSDPVPLPWSKTVVTTDPDYDYARVSATVSGSGTVTCTITNDDTGQVLVTKTAEADGSQYASATASCDSNN